MYYFSIVIKQIVIFSCSCGTDLSFSMLVDMDKEKERRLSAIQETVLSYNSSVKVNFDSVAGLAEAKQTLKEAVLFPVMYPHLFTGKLALI